MTAQWKRQAQRAEAEQDRAELAAYDPRGRVRFIRPARSHIICGRCGQPALSEATPTILEHYTEAHETAPQAWLVGGFEWMHSVGYGPLDDDEVTR